jgi:hypothetical protein
MRCASETRAYSDIDHITVAPCLIGCCAITVRLPMSRPTQQQARAVLKTSRESKASRLSSSSWLGAIRKIRLMGGNRSRATSHGRRHDSASPCGTSVSWGLLLGEVYRRSVTPQKKSALAANTVSATAKGRMVPLVTSNVPITGPKMAPIRMQMLMRARPDIRWSSVSVHFSIVLKAGRTKESAASTVNSAAAQRPHRPLTQEREEGRVGVDRRHDEHDGAPGQAAGPYVGEESR